MRWLAHKFLEGGFMMYPTLLLGAVSLAAGVVSLVMLSRRSERVALMTHGACIAVSLLTVASGLVGWVLGRRATDAAIAGVEPSFQREMQAVGYAESAVNIYFAGCMSALPLLVGFVGLGIYFGSTKPARDAPATS